MNRRILNGMYGGVRGRGLIAPSYSIIARALFCPFYVRRTDSRIKLDGLWAQ